MGTRMIEYRKLLKLGLPIMVGQLGTIVTGFVDNMMVGHYSTAALAASSFCNNFFNMAMLGVMGFTYGITPLVAALSAQGGKEAETGRLVRTAARVNTVFCAIVMVIMGVLYFLLEQMGQPAELLPLIKPYYLLCLMGLLPVMAFNLWAQWSYGIGNTSTPMWIILGVNVLNVLGNWLLIFGTGPFPELGLTGAGISTLAARVVAGAAIVRVFFRMRRYTAYREGFCRSAGGYDDARIWHTSLPVSLQLTCETAAFSGSAVLCGWLGTIPLAAFQVVVVLGTLGFVVYYAMGAAVAVRVGNAAGSGDVRAMRASAWAGYHLMLVIMLISSLIFAFAGPAIIGLFTNDHAVRAVAVSLIVPLILYQLGDATQITFANALRGTSRVMSMLWSAVTAYLVLGLPSSYLLAFTLGLGVYGIVLSFSVSLFSAAALYLFFFLRITRPRP